MNRDYNWQAGDRDPTFLFRLTDDLVRNEVWLHVYGPNAETEAPRILAALRDMDRLAASEAERERLARELSVAGGEWESAHGCREGGALVAVTGPDDDITGESDRIAMLFAAAPDLLTELRAQLDGTGTRQSAMKAIAKATGGAR